MALSGIAWRSRHGGYSWSGHSALADGFARDSGYAESVDKSTYRMRVGARHLSIDTLREWTWHDEAARDVRGGIRAMTGTDHRLPLADRRVVTFFASLPRDQFLREGTTRYLARRLLAAAGAPMARLSSQTRGRQNGDWFARLSAARPGWRAEIAHLKQRPEITRIVDLERIEVLLDNWPADHHAAEPQRREYLQLLTRGMEVAQFLAWHSRGNAMPVDLVD